MYIHRGMEAYSQTKEVVTLSFVFGHNDINLVVLSVVMTAPQSIQSHDEYLHQAHCALILPPCFDSRTCHKFNPVHMYSSHTTERMKSTKVQNSWRYIVRRAWMQHALEIPHACAQIVHEKGMRKQLSRCSLRPCIAVRKASSGPFQSLSRSCKIALRSFCCVHEARNRQNLVEVSQR